MTGDAIAESIGRRMAAIVAAAALLDPVIKAGGPAAWYAEHLRRRLQYRVGEVLSDLVDFLADLTVEGRS